MRPLPIVAVAAALAGCASGAEQRWYLNGRSQQQFSADHQTCGNYAADAISDENMDSAGRMLGNRQGGLGAMMVMLEGVSHEARFAECMTGLGYRAVPSR